MWQMSQSDWCPSELVPYVFRVELTDAAVAVGATMRDRSYWSLNNVRAKPNRDGLIEGKIREDKMYPLDVADPPETLKALLEYDAFLSRCLRPADQLAFHLSRRKAEWQKETGYVDEGFFKELTIADAPLDRFFHSTVEVRINSKRLCVCSVNIPARFYTQNTPNREYQRFSAPTTHPAKIWVEYCVTPFGRKALRAAYSRSVSSMRKKLSPRT